MGCQLCNPQDVDGAVAVDRGEVLAVGVPGQTGDVAGELDRAHEATDGPIVDVDATITSHDQQLTNSLVASVRISLRTSSGNIDASCLFSYFEAMVS